MNHDFPPVAATRGGPATGRTWLPEAFVIGAIFALVWIAFAFRILHGGLGW